MKTRARKWSENHPLIELWREGQYGNGCRYYFKIKPENVFVNLKKITFLLVNLILAKCRSCKTKLTGNTNTNTNNNDVEIREWTSHAKWPLEVYKGTDGKGISTDTHRTKEGAVAVCVGLRKKGFGGEGKHFPISTWVT